jgi:tRNA-splicing ligase RtcB (3'-phosphate/5'-hydroxy nucleic acid ligase)
VSARTWGFNSPAAYIFGGVAEWLKATVLKIVGAYHPRGFESHRLFFLLLLSSPNSFQLTSDTRGVDSFPPRRKVMSLIPTIRKVGKAHYVLPKAGSMKVDVHAYFSEDLFAQVEDLAWSQAYNAASYPGVTAAFLMPDAHIGFNVPIGCVIVTDGVLAQAASGFDINCGVLYGRVKGLHAEAIQDKATRRHWIEAVESRIALGIGSHRPAGARKVDERLVLDLIHHGVEPLGVDPDYCERVKIPIPVDFDPRLIGRAWKKAIPQMGSLGGGNHFIEMQVDEASGDVWVMLHSGSRGFGWEIANHYFYKGSELRGIPSKRRETSWLYADEPLGKEYWAAHNAAANYAIANRWSMFAALRSASQEVFSLDVEPFYEISHNLIQEEILTPLLPGEPQDHHAHCLRGLVHRKGATRAFPAYHPRLHRTRWEETGHPVLIPGSMYHGAAILYPQRGAHSTACSVNHGSGRVLGRGAARRGLALRQASIDEEMSTTRRILGGVEVEGILTNTRLTPLDECRHVYKPLDTVLSVLETEDIATVSQRLYPVANIKGS